MKKLINLLAVYILSFNLISCSDSSRELGLSAIGTYPHPKELKTDVAWIVLEWNGTLFGYGSGFLIDKEKGAFYTNKHVSNMFNALGQGSHKLFFNGTVYNIEIVQTPPLADAALIRITNRFDSSTFPDPSKISYEKPKIGDEVLIGGFHSHGYYIRQSDEAEGYKFELIPIYRDYYKARMRNLEKEKEVVYEKLDGKIASVDLTWDQVVKGFEQTPCGELNEKNSFIDEIRNSVNYFVQVQISKDHKFSFGGLSGSPVRNSKGEIIGILTRQDLCRFDYDREELEEKGETLLNKQLWDTVYFVPIDEIKNLSSYLR